MRPSSTSRFILTGLLASAIVLGGCADDPATGTDSMTPADASMSDASMSDASSDALTVDIGPDQTIHLPADQVTLTAIVGGKGSTTATIAWSQTSGAAAMLSGASTSTLTATGLTLGVYGFHVLVTNAAGETASDDVLVTVATDATLCPGTTYYVSTTGSDGNTGTQASPWATVAKATSAVAAGSTIHVAAGTYTEAQMLALPVGVCLEGEGPTTVLKSTLTADWTPLLAADSPEGTDGHQHISNLVFDGQSLSTFWGIEVAGRSNVSIHDVTVRDFKDRGVIMTGRDDNMEGPPTVFAKGLSFYDNTILNSAAYNTANGVYGRGCLNVGGTEGMLIYNNVITQNQRPVGYNGWPIKYANGGYNRGIKIFKNQLTKIPFTGSYPGENGWDFVVEMFFDQGTEFYANVVSGGGFDSNTQTKGAYAYSLWIHDNAFSIPAVVNSDNNAVTLEFSTDGVVIENNTIDKMSHCLIFTPRPGNTITNVTIVGNLCTHASKGAGDGSNAGFINMSSGQDQFTVDGLTIYNNTFLAEPGNRPWFGIELGDPNLGTIKNVKIKNNILGHTNTALINGGGTVMANIDISNNDLFDSVAGNDPAFGVAPKNYTYANNLHVNPMFVSATDFHLQAGSPAIDKGVDVGRPFSGAAPDIGYAEH